MRNSNISIQKPDKRYMHQNPTADADEKQRSVSPRGPKTREPERTGRPPLGAPPGGALAGAHVRESEPARDQKGRAAAKPGLGRWPHAELTLIGGANVSPMRCRRRRR